VVGSPRVFRPKTMAPPANQQESMSRKTPATELRGSEKRRRGKRERKEGAGHIDSAEGGEDEDEELAPVEPRRPLSASHLKRAKTANGLLEKESTQLGDELEGYEWSSKDSPWLHMLTKNQEEGFDQQHAQLEGEDGVFSITSAHFRSVGPRPRIPWTPGCWMSGTLIDAGGGAHVSDDAGRAGSSSSISLHGQTTQTAAPQWPGHTGPPLDAHAIARLMARLFRRSDAPPHASDGLHRVALRELLRTRRSPAYRAKLLDLHGQTTQTISDGEHEAPRENTGPRGWMDVSAKTLRAMWREQPVSRRGAPRMTEEAIERNAATGLPHLHENAPP